MLALEAVLPTGEVIHTGSKAVKNVVGYDLTQLLVGSEGTLAIITEITLRLIPRPPAQATLLAAFASIDGAVDAVTQLIQRRVVPAAVELVDADSLRAIAAVRRASDGRPRDRRRADHRSRWLEGRGGRREARSWRTPAGPVHASAVRRAASDAERDEIWAPAPRVVARVEADLAN